MRSFIFIVFILSIIGCADHKIDTAEEWCEQITGVNLERKYSPSWAVIFSVTNDPEAIRDSYTDLLNSTHLEKIQNRAPKMAWREGNNLHLENLSFFLEIDSETIINEWSEGVKIANEFNYKDSASKCLYGTLASMFDTLIIHTKEPDEIGFVKEEHISVIKTKPQI